MSMSTLVLNDLALFGLVLFAYYLTSYMTEKGKNLATKEDVQEITTKVEAVRTQFAAQLEIQKSELHRMLDVHQLAFEWEFPVLRELWTKINDVLAEAHWLHLSSAQRPGGNSDEAKTKLSKFIAVLEACDRITMSNKPFLHEDVYTAAVSFMELLSEIYNKAVDECTDPMQAHQFWTQADKQREQVLKGAASICETLRHRVAPAFQKGYNLS